MFIEVKSGNEVLKTFNQFDKACEYVKNMNGHAHFEIDDDYCNCADAYNHHRGVITIQPKNYFDFAKKN